MPWVEFMSYFGIVTWALYTGAILGPKKKEPPEA